MIYFNVLFIAVSSGMAIHYVHTNKSSVWLQIHILATILNVAAVIQKLSSLGV